VTERLLTARELSEWLGVSSETILRWTRARKLPAVRMPGGAIRFRGVDIERWVAERSTMVDTGPTSKAAPRGAVTPTRGLSTGGTSSHA
jgi:excisionase family DNA binding protein